MDLFEHAAIASCRLLALALLIFVHRDEIIEWFGTSIDDIPNSTKSTVLTQASSSQNTSEAQTTIEPQAAALSPRTFILGIDVTDVLPTLKEGSNAFIEGSKNVWDNLVLSYKKGGKNIA